MAPSPGEVTEVQRGLHSRLFARIIQEFTPDGEPASRMQYFEEIGTGTCYLDSSGQYQVSDPAFTLTAEGFAVAERCQHKLIISPSLDDPDGYLDCLMVDGQRLRGTVLGMNVVSRVTGKALQIGAARSVVGEQTAPNEITFFDAFEGLLKANVRIRNGTMGTVVGGVGIGLAGGFVFGFVVDKASEAVGSVITAMQKANEQAIDYYASTGISWMD